MKIYSKYEECRYSMWDSLSALSQKNPIYNNGEKYDCPKSEKLEKRTVSLPMNEKLSFLETEYIIDKVKENL